MLSKILIAGVFAASFSGFASAAEMKECNDETFSMVMKEVAAAPADKKGNGHQHEQRLLHAS